MLIVSRVAHEKNIDFLVETVDRMRGDLPDVLLVIAGEGPAEDHLRATVRARALGGHVLFVGYLDRRGPLQDCYRASDLFVFASRSETQGLVLLEALALGVPVLALAELGTREIVLPQRGAVAAPDDPAQFAVFALDLLRDPARRARLSAEGRTFAREWGSAGIAQRLREIYAEGLTSPNLRAASATVPRTTGVRISVRMSATGSATRARPARSRCVRARACDRADPRARRRPRPAAASRL